jgi:hypothetical protein
MRNKILPLVLTLVLAIPCIAAVTFTDVPADHWAYPYVDKLVEYKILAGYPDNTFRGDRTLNRYEFSKALVATMAYIETTRGVNLKAETAKEVSFKDVKTTHWAYPYLIDLVSKYQIITGFPDGTFRGQKTLNRFEVTVAVARAVERLEKATGAKIKQKAITLPDVPRDHWAYPGVVKLISAGLISTYQDGSFKGKEPVSRYLLASILAKFVGLSVERPPAPSLIDRSLEITPRAQAFISGGWGNIYEYNSGTNNWYGYSAAAGYGNIFKIWKFAGNYELTGKYGFNQINYMVPDGSGGIGSKVVNENRYELELNTIHPVVKFYGIDGKLLVGMKYVNLSNPTAPTDFTGLNVGIATAAKVLGKRLLARAFYSLPIARINSTPSALGQPSQLFDYEASVDAVIFSYPVLLGISGELMTLSGGSTRFYNNFFVRYFIL